MSAPTECPSCQSSSGLYYADIGPRVLQCDNCGWWDGKPEAKP